MADETNNYARRWRRAGLVIGLGAALVAVRVSPWSLGTGDARGTTLERAGSRSYVASKEYYQSTASFSEVAMARGELKAVAERYLADIESRLGPLHLARNAGGEGTESTTSAVDRQVEELRGGIQAFEGTSQESMFRQHLLAVLRRAQRHAAWLESYLDMAYRRPTDPLVGRLADYAATVAGRLGRQDELVEVFSGIERIPMEFEAKGAVRSSLSRVRMVRAVGGGRREDTQACL